MPELNRWLQIVEMETFVSVGLPLNSIVHWLTQCFLVQSQAHIHHDHRFCRLLGS